MPARRTVNTPDGSIHVRVLGTGPPVLCLHGVSAHGRSWEGVSRLVRGRATFVMPDLLGRGASDAAPHLAFTLDDEVRRVIDLLDAMPETAGRPHSAPPDRADGLFLAGHSQGAAIALAVASRRSDVRGILLTSPVTPWTARPAVLAGLRPHLIRRGVAGIFSPLRGPLAALVIRRAAGPGFSAPRELVEAYAAPYAERRRAETLMALLRDWRPEELEARLPTEPPPVRVISGALDPRIDPGDARKLAGTLGASFTLVEDGGHVLPEQHPELVAGELRRLLDSVGDGNDAAVSDNHS